MVKKHPASLGTERLISTNLDIIPIQLNLVHPFKSYFIKSTLIISCHIRLGLPNDSFVSLFPLTFCRRFSPHSCMLPYLSNYIIKIVAGKKVDNFRIGYLNLSLSLSPSLSVNVLLRKKNSFIVLFIVCICGLSHR